MFKKRQIRNIRKKLSDDEDDRKNASDRSDNESRGSNGSSSIPVNKTLATTTTTSENVQSSGITKTVTSTNSLLSFEDEEDGEVFQVRKSAASRNLERAQRKAAKNPKNKDEKPSSSTDGGLRSTTKATSQKTDDAFIIRQVGNIIGKTKISDSPPPSPPAPTILTGHEAEDVGDDSGDDSDPVRGKFKDVLTSGAIPDANLIHMARKQRQLAREMGTSETPANSYIPLKKVDDTQKYKKNEKSRLVREDDENDNSDSGEEAGRFYSKLRDEEEEERRKVEADFLRVEQGDSDEDKDDELDRWEKEQIRKGVSRNQMSYFGQDYMTSLHGYGVDFAKNDSRIKGKEIKEPQPMDIDMDFGDDDDVMIIPNPKGESHRRTPLPKFGGGSQSAETVLTFQDVKARLDKRNLEEQSNHNARLLEREKVREFLSENETTTSKLEESMPLLSTQHQFYQEMRTYVKDLLDCFNEKVPFVEQVSARMMELRATRANFLIKRRQQDVKDQYEECSAASSGKLQLLQQDSDRMMRAAEREARRTRRRQGREKSLASLGHHEGMSSDEEEAPSRMVNFSNEKEKLASDTTDIFKDTVDEFCSIDNILDRFMEWRNRYKDAFDQAFIIYCLPKLLAPLINWKLSSWTPLRADSPPLKTMDWYISLDHAEKSQRERFPDDAEEFRLLFTVVDTTLLPRVKEIVEYVWDPTSTTQTSNLNAFMMALLREHLQSVNDGKNFKPLMDAVQTRIKRSLDDDLFTPIYSKDTVENKATGAAAFLDRQFWFSLKMIRNISVWTGVFSNKDIQELTFDGVVNRHVVLGIQCGGVMDLSTLTKCKAVCHALPPSWFNNLKDGESLPQAEPLCKVLVRVADELNKSKTLDKNNVKDATKELHRLLRKLRGWKHAESIEQKYRIS